MQAFAHAVPPAGDALPSPRDPCRPPRAPLRNLSPELGPRPVQRLMGPLPNAFPALHSQILDQTPDDQL